MAYNEVTSMMKSADIVKKLEEFRLGCDMGEREYLWRDEAANLLMEENDVMIRLIQGVNKAVQDKERDERDIAKGYRTVEEIKERWNRSRYGLGSQGAASGLVRTLGKQERHWKEFYHELVVDDKLIKADLEQFMRCLQYIGDQGWNRILDKLIQFQNQTVDQKKQLRSDLMQVIKVLFLITQHVPPMRRVWERKEEVMPVLVHKCMGQSYDLLRQTALVIILHLILATKSSDDVDWLAIDCDFARKLRYYLESTQFLKANIAPVLNHIMMSYIALIELGGEKTRKKLKSLDLHNMLRRVMDPEATDPKKKWSDEEIFTKGLVETYLKLAEDHTSVKYFTKYPREKRISFRWGYRGVPVFCSNTDCARPQEPKERFRHCGRCMVTYYCSPSCQKQHWKTEKGGPKHKVVCVPLPESKRQKAEDETKEKSNGAASEEAKDAKSDGTSKDTKDSSRSSSSKDSKEEGATGGKTNPMDKDDITAMMIVPGRYEETKDGKKKEPSVEDIRNEVQEKVAKFGLAVESVQRVDCRNNPALQELLHKLF